MRCVCENLHGHDNLNIASVCVCTELRSALSGDTRWLATTCRRKAGKKEKPQV